MNLRGEVLGRQVLRDGDSGSEVETWLRCELLHCRGRSFPERGMESIFVKWSTEKGKVQVEFTEVRWEVCPWQRQFTDMGRIVRWLGQSKAYCRLGQPALAR